MYSTSADGMSYHRYTAFTMIELLVVMLIIGILINFIAVNINRNTPLEELKTEADRFISLARLASEEALIRSELIGISISNDSYHFLYRGEKEWFPIDDNVFRERTLPKNINIEVNTDKMNGNSMQDTQQDLPNIIFFASGEMTPFELIFSSQVILDFYRINGAETGELTVNHVLKD